MTDEIRRSIDARLAVLYDGSGVRQERIRARFADMKEKEESVRKRPWPRVLALALVSMLLVGTGLAAGLSLNLFDVLSKSHRGSQYYWEQDQLKLNSLREKNTLISTSSIAPEGVYPEKMIQFHDAYYDGHVLLVGYIHGEREWYQPFIEWTPTEEELAELAASAILRDKDGKYLFNEAADAILQQAMKSGQPCGIKSYYITDGYRFETTAGNLLWSGQTHYAESIHDDRSGYYLVEQYASPLPEEIRDLDTIDIQMPFKFDTEYFWFDGHELYSWYGPQERAMLTVTIGRDMSVLQGRYENEKVILNGTEVTVEADAIGPYLLHVVLNADEPYFSPGQGGPHTWIALDEAGEEHSMSMRFYDDMGLEHAPMMQKVIFNYKRKNEYVLFIYDDCSEDGRSKEIWLDLFGEIPEALTMVITQDDTEVTTVTLRLAD